MTNPYDSTMPPASDRASLIDLLRGRTSPEQQQAMSVLDRVNQKYVESGRDKVVRKVFDEFLTYTMAKQPNGRIGKGGALYITGESGAGKSYLAEHLLATHPVLEPVSTAFGFKRPFISISLEGPATLANLGNEILQKSGYTARRKIARGDVWAMLPKELASGSIFLVHIDETQHLLANKSERQGLVKSLKGLMNDPEWPMRFLLTGMPETNDMIYEDEQAERRARNVVLEPVRIPEELKLAHRIVEELCKDAGLDSSFVMQSDLPERICHAANYQYGRIADVVVAGITSVLLEGTGSLDRNAFARAFVTHSHARGKPDVNPFLSDRWKNLKPGYFIVKKSDQ